MILSALKNTFSVIYVYIFLSKAICLLFISLKIQVVAKLFEILPGIPAKVLLIQLSIQIFLKSTFCVQDHINGAEERKTAKLWSVL